MSNGAEKPPSLWWWMIHRVTSECNQHPHFFMLWCWVILGVISECNTTFFHVVVVGDPQSHLWVQHPHSYMLWCWLILSHLWVQHPHSFMLWCWVIVRVISECNKHVPSCCGVRWSSESPLSATPTFLNVVVLDDPRSHLWVQHPHFFGL